MFPSAAIARASPPELGSITLDKSGWHVYSNMEHVLERRTVTRQGLPLRLPLLRRGGGRLSTATCCRVTDDLLARSISFGIGVFDANLAPFGLRMRDDETAARRVAEQFCEVASPTSPARPCEPMASRGLDRRRHRRLRPGRPLVPRAVHRRGRRPAAGRHRDLEPGTAGAGDRRAPRGDGRRDRRRAPRQRRRRDGRGRHPEPVPRADRDPRARGRPARRRRQADRDGRRRKPRRCSRPPNAPGGSCPSIRTGAGTVTS